MYLFVNCLIAIVLFIPLSFCFFVIIKVGKENEILRELLSLDTDWIEILQRGKRLSSFFEANQIKTVAILGYNDHAFLVTRELEKDVEVQFCVVEKHEGLTLIPGIDTIGLDKLADRIHDVDAVIDVLPKTNVNIVKNYFYENYPHTKCLDVKSLVFYASEL